jgi:hypothetical protein
MYSLVFTKDIKGTINRLISMVDMLSCFTRLVMENDKQYGKKITNIPKLRFQVRTKIYAQVLPIHHQIVQFIAISTSLFGSSNILNV